VQNPTLDLAWMWVDDLNAEQPPVPETFDRTSGPGDKQQEPSCENRKREDDEQTGSGRHQCDHERKRRDSNRQVQQEMEGGLQCGRRDDVGVNAYGAPAKTRRLGIGVCHVSTESTNTHPE